MSIARSCKKLVGLTCVFTTLGLGAVVSAQVIEPVTPPEDYEPPAGYTHTGWGYHTGKTKYATKPLPPDVQGPEEHTGQILYLWVYYLKKNVTPKPIGG